MKRNKLYMGGMALIAATMLSNILNFAFNVYLGRNLTLDEFGELTLFTSLLYLISIPLGAFSAATAHSIAKLFGAHSKQYAHSYFRHILAKTHVWGIGLTLGWFVLTPFLSDFFHLETYHLMAMFAPLWLFSVVSANYSGYLKGILSFGAIAILTVVETIVRLISVVAIVSAGYHQYAMLSIVISFAATAATGWWLCRGPKPITLKTGDSRYNTAFFLISALTGVSMLSFLTLDVVLVKHYLPAAEAGRYGLLSLVGKMTYFLGSLFAPFMIPLVSHNEGAKKDSRREFIFLFAVTAVFSLGAFVGLGLFGGAFLPLLFGDKFNSVLQYMPVYILAMCLFTLSQPVVSYFQAKERYSYTLVGFLVSLLQIVLTVIYHKNLSNIVWITLLTSAANLTFMFVLYIFGDRLQAALNRSVGIFRKFRYAA